MRKPAVDVVTRKGHRVVVRASKKGFALASVEVVATGNNNVTLTTHKANLSNGYKNEWLAHIPVETEVHGRNINIVVKDQAGNIIRYDLNSNGILSPVLVSTHINCVRPLPFIEMPTITRTHATHWTTTS